MLGAGPAGCATALALRQKGVSRICIVEPSRFSGVQVGETLPPETWLILDQLGLWNAFLAEGHEVCLGSCSSWGNVELGYNDFVLNPYAQGWHLDRPRFNSFLRRRAMSSGIVLLAGAKLCGCGPDGRQQFRLHLRKRRSVTSVITARYVVDATGVASAFARRVGAQRILFDRLTFVYGFFAAQHGASVSRLTMIEAAESGWWYAAGLPGGRVAVSFATDPEMVRRFRLADEERWFAEVSRTRYIAARVNECRFLRGSLAIRAAPSCLLDRVAGARWLAVGDAAAAYDPIASQGIYKALAGGVVAAAAIAAALELEKDIETSYSASIVDDFKEYTANCNYHYRLEKRWASSAFWQRRVERTELQAPALPT